MSTVPIIVVAAAATVGVIGAALALKAVQTAWKVAQIVGGVLALGAIAYFYGPTCAGAVAGVYFMARSNQPGAEHYDYEGLLGGLLLGGALGHGLGRAGFSLYTRLI